MKRAIEGFHRDDAGDWVAELSCGHGRHVRDDPPFTVRAWVRTEAGRARMLGQGLDCVRCDRREIPEGFEPYRTTARFDAESLPAALRERHDTKPGVWARIQVFEGAIGYRIHEPVSTRQRLTPDVPGIVVPEVAHQLEVCGPVSLHVEFWRRATPEPVVIDDSDPAWTERFERERERLASQLAPLAPRIEHVGSTAVPGLPAKPIVDLMLGVERLADLDPHLGALERDDWRYRPEHEREIPDRRFLCKPRVPPRAFHLHAVEIGSPFWEDHLRFRDRLRADAALAARYVALKRALAVRHRDDREAYADAKSDFVAAALGDG